MNELTIARLHAGLSVSDACKILGRSLRTWQHWKQHGAPDWALHVLAIYAGDLTPLGWDGWTLRQDRLYAPDLAYGWERGHLYAEWWNRQRLAFVDRQMKDLELRAPSPQPDPKQKPRAQNASVSPLAP